MKDENCIFCKLANGDIPANVIYEDEDFTVILDAEPVSKGHALILPKAHYKNIYELSEDTAAKLYPLARRMALHMTETLHCDGFNVLQNNGAAAGQSVFHFHTHLIPRYEDAPNNATLLGFSHPDITKEEIEDICQRLK